MADESARRVRKRILVVCQMDGFGNSLRAPAIEAFLQSRGHTVRLADTYQLSRLRPGTGLLSKLPGRGVRRLALYAAEVALSVIARLDGSPRRALSYYTLLAESHLRGSILNSTLAKDEFDLVICETPYDVGLLADTTTAVTFYDCPTPWADELYYEGRLTPRQHAKLRARERGVFESVDFLSFHWDSYARYAVAHYGISGHNLLQVNFGCTPSPRRASFRDPPRVAYLGSLSSRFIDLPLLARLSALYPNIDVFGGPRPDPALGLNYRGYAAPTVLADYQLGLITCTNDELRRNGFSAKHLEYLAYGLPVLVPAWRKDIGVLRGSVAYDEATFTSVVSGLSNERVWQRRSDEAYEQAQQLRWENTLVPLLTALGGEASTVMAPQPSK